MITIIMILIIITMMIIILIIIIIIIIIIKIMMNCLFQSGDFPLNPPLVMYFQVRPRKVPSA